MNILAQDKPIIKYSVRELQRMHTILHYELSGLEDEIKNTDYGEELIELWEKRNKARIMYDFVKGLLANYDQLKKHSNYI